MKWTKFSLKTTTYAVDLVSNMLDELGVEGIEIEDKVPLTDEEKAQMFVDILPQLEEDDHIATVNFYRDPEEDPSVLLGQVKEGLNELKDFIDIGSGEITISETEDKDWMNNWKQYFKPFRLDDNIVIKPTWEQLKDQKEDDIVIEIDPGSAFGTGSHETTKLCIHGLKEHVNDTTRLLDVGCGSGILSIIGLKLGAKSALAIDIDPHAVDMTWENAEVNHIIGDKFDAWSGNIIADEELQQKVGMECYDVVVANILADVIIPLSGEIGKHLIPGGLFITSGIIDMKRDEVEAAMKKNGFEIVEVNTMKDWVSIIAKKPE
ncbi:ribosomal protein L11 methyltransferase [Lachnospiraceae bacterium KM106-2]|nr:ribosomal protein L11 methyltransferase [Lachnospiraceae bacterium KM106-2]